MNEILVRSWKNGFQNMTDAELEEATKAALAKLEPAILVFMGALVGYIVAAIYIAMFSMYGAM